MSQLPPTRKRISRAAFILIAVWAAALACGMAVMARFDNTPGLAAQPASQWPAIRTASRQELSLMGAGHETVVMFIHPRCSCSRSSLGNLAEIMARTGGKLEGYVIAYEPTANSGRYWTSSDLVTTAAAIPGIRVVMDPAALVAARFRVHTSGQTMLFSPQGRLLFSGGITSARGVFGDCDGMDSIVSWVTRDHADRSTAPVFGCDIRRSAAVDPPLPADNQGSRK